MPSLPRPALAAALLTASAIASILVFAITPAVAAPKTELTLAVRGEPDSGFDPTLGWGEYGYPLFQSTLLKRNATLDLIPDLATAWTLSDDRTSWTVTIRGDAKFSDGRPLTARDVAFTYETAKKAGSVLDLTELASVKAIDATTVVFTLKAPRITFLNTLAALGIVPEHAYKAETYGRAPVGSGPFRLLSWTEGEQAIVEPNPYYYGAKPAFSKVTFLFTKDDSTYAAAKAGKLDVAAMSNALAGGVPSGMVLVDAKTVDNRGLAFPMQPDTGRKTDKGYPIGNSVTSDPAIRKAVNVALDRKALAAAVLNGFGRPAYGPADDLPWDNPDHRLADADPAAARKILADAGWKPGADGVLEKNGVRARFSVYYSASDTTRQALALASADMIRPLGIDVEVLGKSWDEIKPKMHANVVVFGADSHDPFETYNLYVGNGAEGGWWFNTGLYDNPTVKAHLDKALTATTMADLIPEWKAAAWDGKTGYGMKGDAAWAWMVNIDHVYFVSKCLDIGPRQIEPHGHGLPITYNLEDWRWTCP